MSNANPPTVLLVEDDQDMRDSLAFLLRSHGHEVHAFATADQLLEYYDPDRPGCLVLDLQLPGMTGLQLYQALIEHRCCHPFLVITGHGDVPTAVEAMKDGAIDFLEKPFDHHVFLRRVEEAIRQDKIQRDLQLENREVEDRIQSLTPREREIMRLVVDGKLTKQIAGQLGISPKTVEVHRSHVTRKMNVQSVAQLVQLVTRYEMSQGVVLPTSPPTPG